MQEATLQNGHASSSSSSLRGTGQQQQQQHHIIPGMPGHHVPNVPRSPGGNNLNVAEIARTYPDLTEDERQILVNIRKRKMELMQVGWDNAIISQTVSSNGTTEPQL
jgi:hypothetical protein